jgi:hypothetical protein
MKSQFSDSGAILPTHVHIKPPTYFPLVHHEKVYEKKH